jgi:hypothetical protein
MSGAFREFHPRRWHMLTNDAPAGDESDSPKRTLHAEPVFRLRGIDDFLVASCLSSN